MAFRNLFRNYYYGRPGKGDFTEADLPENRLQLFWQVFRVRRGDMVGLNLLYLASWLPAIAWSFLNLLQVGAVLEGRLPAEALRQILFFWLLLLWPLSAATGPFNAGISLVMHRWAQDEHSFPFADFKAGLRQNWRQGLLFGAIDGFIPLLTYVCAAFYANLASGSALFLAPMAAVLLVAAVWWLAAPLMPGLIVSYKLNFRGVVRNALLMALAQLPRAVALRLATLALPIAAAACLLLFPGTLQWIVMIGSTLYALILLSFNKLIWASFTNFLGEKYLNVKIPGAPTDIGLRPREKR